MSHEAVLLSEKEVGVRSLGSLGGGSGNEPAEPSQPF